MQVCSNVYCGGYRSYREILYTCTHFINLGKKRRTQNIAFFPHENRTSTQWHGRPADFLSPIPSSAKHQHLVLKGQCLPGSPGRHPVTWSPDGFQGHCSALSEFTSMGIDMPVCLLHSIQARCPLRRLNCPGSERQKHIAKIAFALRLMMTTSCTKVRTTSQYYQAAGFSSN
jgi:hypothetical protein